MKTASVYVSSYDQSSLDTLCDFAPSVTFGETVTDHSNEIIKGEHESYEGYFTMAEGIASDFISHAKTLPGVVDAGVLEAE